MIHSDILLSHDVDVWMNNEDIIDLLMLELNLDAKFLDDQRLYMEDYWLGPRSSQDYALGLLMNCDYAFLWLELILRHYLSITPSDEPEMIASGWNVEDFIIHEGHMSNFSGIR